MRVSSFVTLKNINGRWQLCHFKDIRRVKLEFMLQCALCPYLVNFHMQLIALLSKRHLKKRKRTRGKVPLNRNQYSCKERPPDSATQQQQVFYYCYYRTCRENCLSFTSSVICKPLIIYYSQVFHFKRSWQFKNPIRLIIYIHKRRNTLIDEEGYWISIVTYQTLSSNQEHI